LKADSYVKDDIPINMMIRIIHFVNMGTQTISLEMQNKLLEFYQNVQKGSTDLSRHDLSKRQLEILSLAAKGLSNREIAQKLFITENTVKTQMSIIIRKLGVSNRRRAAILALEKGIIVEPDLHEL
jgi:DNA-binding NarL/FixJ family response regulator